MENADEIDVEVVYAQPERQKLIGLRVPRGSTVKTVLDRSGMLRLHDIDLSVNRVGIYGRIVDLDHPVSEGDRVEIYRPLRADPKEVRRKLARQGKTMKKGRRGSPPG